MLPMTDLSPDPMPNFKELCAELVESVETLLELRPANARPLKKTEERLRRALIELKRVELSDHERAELEAKLRKHDEAKRAES